MGLTDKLAKSGIKVGIQGGLHSRIAAAKMLNDQVEKPLAEACPNRLAIIADFSGSMGGGSGSKLALLGEAVQDFAMRSDESTTAIAVESFPQGFRIELTNDKTSVWMRMFNLNIIGDTPMGQGMSTALEMVKPTRAMLISDGEATDGELSYEMASRYKEKEVICDTVHIGESTSGETRLKRIAEITGGIYMKFKDVATFSTSFHYLLPESRDAIAGMLPEQRSALLGNDE
jgi:Mg-chelatase subunit ChlD